VKTPQTTEEDADDPWTSRWRYPNGILLWLVVQPKGWHSNKDSRYLLITRTTQQFGTCPVLYWMSKINKILWKFNLPTFISGFVLGFECSCI
jgi:hypothetical protein